MARVARITSRMRAAGWENWALKRFSMWALIWEPRPRMKRPWENRWRSWPMWARCVGERGKATAMAVARSIRSVCSAARRSGKKGSCWVSAV